MITLSSILCLFLHYFSATEGKALAAKNTKYKFGDRVHVLVSMVHPFYNPGEKYQYDMLPWPCQKEHMKKTTIEIGSPMNGERSRIAHEYDIRFRRPVDLKSLCGKATLGKKDIKAFQKAIRDLFEYEMFIDDLPVFGQVGFVRNDGSTDPKHYLITHRSFHILYNVDRVISCNITKNFGRPLLLPRGAESLNVDFTYSVKWSPTEVKFADRWAFHLNANPTRHQMEAHWLWVLNSSLLVVLLTGLLAMILLRTLKNDVARYLQLDQIDQEEAADARKDGTFDEYDDSGWKRIRFDVFRPPARPMLFTSMIGVGAQILMITVFLLILACIGYFYPGNHGRIYLCAILLYSTTAYVAGYIASSGHKQFGGEDWMLSCGLTASLYFVPFLAVFGLVNSVAWYHKSSVALPFGTILCIILLWAFVTFPLTAYGAYKGSQKEVFEYPCKVKIVPRPIPTDLPWYYHGAVQVGVSGFLPFMAIYVEVHTIFMSVWGHQFYTLFGILLLTFVILLIVTAFVVILLAYFQLTAEDYKWWWASAFRGGACGIFLQAYAMFYWQYSSSMYGFLQGCIYFGYTLMISYAFALMLGAVGHWATHSFVVKIYAAIKSD